MTDRAVEVRLKGDISDFNRAMLGAAATAKAFTGQLDTSTDRATNLTQSILAIGPALVPIGAAGIPAVAGLTNELGFAAAGAGVAALAFSGVGDALKAVNDYAIDPTAAHLQKMNQTLAEIGPAGRNFVMFLQDLRPQLQGLQDTAQAEFFPGLQEGMEALLTRLPQVERIIGVIATTMGDLASEAGGALAGPEWGEFFDFLEREARPTLLDLGRAIGNFAEGFANLWMAFEPVSSQFSASFLDLARDFAAWTAELDQTEGFQDFLAYIERVGPKAWDTLGALGNALLQIVEAAAPVGEVALPIITALADAISALADSSVGPALIGTVAGISALSRAISLLERANSGSLGTLFGASALGGARKAVRDLPAASKAYLDFGAALGTAGPQVGKFASTSERLGASLRGAGTIATGIALLGTSLTGLDDKLGATNTTLGAMAGLMVTGGPWGLAIGGAIGLLKDLNDASTSTAESLQNFDDDLRASGDSLGEQIGEINNAIRSVKEVGDSSGLDLSDMIGGLEELRDSRREERDAARDQAIEEAGLGSAMATASEATKDQTYALLENIRVKNEAADAAEGIFSAETNYRRALRDATEQGRKSNAGIHENSKAADDNRDALDKLAGAWNRQADAGGQSNAAMRRARENFINVAVSMGVSRGEAKKLADQLLHLPSPKPKVTVVGLKEARAAIRSLDQLLDSLPFQKTVRIVTRNTTVYDHGPTKSASGGLITGPGGPRDDLIPALLSNREFVMQNAAVEKYGVSFMERINALQFADGGLVPQRMTAPGSAAYAAAPAFGPLAVSLVGAQVAIDPHTNIATFVRGEVRMAVDRNNFEQERAVLS